MFDKLAAIEQRYISMEDALMQPGIDGKELARINKERAEIEDIVEVFRRYKLLKAEEDGAKELLNLGDSEMKDLAREELLQVEVKLQAINEELKLLMLPTDPRDHRNVMLEIRAGTGGDEAGLFAADLMRMYARYADGQGWKIEILSASESTKGGFKEVVMMIEGKKVFSRLKFESGVHRVQRVPATEAQGRIHTSACTVAVLAEAEDVDIDINPSDLKIDTFRSSGAGGQHINTTDSAVRITHIPTGVVAECQEERSQHKNRDKAMKLLRTRMLEKVQQDQDAEIRADRKAQVGSGDRSERIRTYNYPQGRITDHRINLTLYKLSEVMTGDLGDILDALGTHYTAELLKSQGLNG